MMTWQRLVRRWQDLVFGSIPLSRKVRAMRLMEEAIELAQSEGVTTVEASAILAQVYGKQPGNPVQELGSVAVTAVLYADAADVDLEDVLCREFMRIMDPVMMDKVRQRNLEGDKIGLEEFRRA